MSRVVIFVSKGLNDMMGDEKCNNMIRMKE